MNDTYLNNQNISNNIILNNPKYSFKGKKSLLNRGSIESYTSYDGDNNETIDNRINDSFSSLALEEVTQREEDIDHLRRFHQERKKIPIPFNQNRRNKNNVNNSFNGVNPLTVDKHLTRATSGKIIPLPRNTNATFENEKKLIENYGYKRSISGDRINVNLIQSKFNSSTENKYNFSNKKTDLSKQNEIPNVIVNNRKIPSNQNKNIPIKTAKVTKLNTNMLNKNITGKIMDNYKSNNYHSINNINGNSNIIINLPLGNQNQINFVKNLGLDNKENIFVNNSNKTNYSGDKFQNSLKLINSNNFQIPSSNGSLKNTPKNTSRNINISNPPVSSFELINGNNYYSNNDNVRLNDINAQNLRKMNNNIQQRLTNVPKMIGNSYTNNIDMNFQRMTLPQKIMTNIEQNNQNLWMINNVPIYNQPSIQINQQMNLNQNLKQIELNSARRTIATPLNNNINNIGINNINYMNKTDIMNIGINKVISNQNKFPINIRNPNIQINNLKNISIPNQIINPVENQQRNTIANTNILKQEYQNSNNTFNSQPDPKVQENQRMTQIPRNINNQIYGQNQNNYISPKNNSFNPSVENETKFDSSGRIKSYGILTLAGKDASGKQKTNQDSFVFKGNINKIKDFNIFGVLDGHGPEGHHVSKFAAESITSYLINHPEIKCLSDPEQIYQKFKENKCNIITQSFVETDNKLKNVKFDALESGCTCVLVIHIGTHIMCANAGDSRAIVVFNERDNNDTDYFFGEALSRDYKPEIPEETNRILRNGGVVTQIKDENGEGVGPYRVWARGEDYPGLAMSRSIGDLKGKKIGVIPDPGILEYDISKNTKYIVVCSDGVWEFLENESVIDIGKKYYIENNPKGFCHELVNQSLSLWEENDNAVDDITAVVAFF